MPTATGKQLLVIYSIYPTLCAILFSPKPCLHLSSATASVPRLSPTPPQDQLQQQTPGELSKHQAGQDSTRYKVLPGFSYSTKKSAANSITGEHIYSCSSFLQQGETRGLHGALQSLTSAVRGQGMPGEAAGLSSWLGQPSLNQQQPPAGQASPEVGVIPHSQPRASEWHSSSEPLALPSQTFCISNATFTPAALTFSCLPSIKHLLQSCSKKTPKTKNLLPHIATLHLKTAAPCTTPSSPPSPFPASIPPRVLHLRPTPATLKTQPRQPGQCCGALSWP